MELKPIIIGLISLTILVASTEVTRAGFKEGEAYYDAGKFTEAFKEFEPLAKEGDVRAQYLLGLMFVRGLGVPQDKRIALKWWQQAADNGHRSAQYNLGTMHHRGDGVQRNIDKAVKWYKRAAEQGHAIAQWRLGNHYQFSGSPDYQKAHQWYQKAAEQGYALAQYQLGALHLLKRWETSDIEAYMWLTLAKKGLISKDPFIKANRDLNQQSLDTLGQSMTSEKIDKAKELVKSWKPKIVDKTHGQNNDCAKKRGEAQIQACTRVINSKRLFGKRISKLNLANSRLTRGCPHPK